MKITGNNIEVVKHQSVIAPIVVVVLIFLWWWHVRCCSVISARSPA